MSKVKSIEEINREFNNRWRWIFSGGAYQHELFDENRIISNQSGSEPDTRHQNPQHSLPNSFEHNFRSGEFTGNGYLQKPAYSSNAQSESKPDSCFAKFMNTAGEHPIFNIQEPYSPKSKAGSNLKKAPEKAKKETMPLAASEIEKAAKKKKKRGIASLIGDSIFYLVIAVVVLISGFFLLGKDENGMILNHGLKNVLTPSMQDVIPAGSLIVIKRVDPNTLQLGDIITFNREEAGGVISVTHQIVEIIENFEDTGERAFTTWGTSNELWDRNPVYANDIEGIVVKHMPGLGDTLEYIQENPWIPFALMFGIIVLIITVSALFRKKTDEEKSKKVNSTAKPAYSR